jgi:hypothetical protein
MLFTVQGAGMVLGHSELLDRDEGMGVASGVFLPAPDYARVQAVFRLFAEANAETSEEPTDEEKLERYYAARDALGLQLVDESGRRVATRTIHIADYSVEGGAGAIEIEVAVNDAGFFKRLA